MIQGRAAMADGGVAEGGASSLVALRYRVEGMDCPSCASKIETAGKQDAVVAWTRTV